MFRFLLLAMAAMLAAPAFAQDTSGRVSVDAPEPSGDQLAAARELMAFVMPESQRAQMVDGMVEMIDRLLHQMVGSIPGLTDALQERPGAEEVFARFVDREVASTRVSLTRDIPGLVDAMTVAYARRFTPEQLEELRAFFATPTGQTYVGQSASIMSDPAIAEWQKHSIQADMAELPAKLERLMTDLESIREGPAPNGG